MFYLKRKNHTKSDFTISMTKVVRVVGLKKNLDLFFQIHQHPI